MERPSWAPVVLSGALPRELPDFLAMVILGLTSVEASYTDIQLFGAALGSWLLLLITAPSCALASLSNGSKKQREELALFAYGGAGWQIHLRYFLRGAVLSAVAISPLVLRQAMITAEISPFQAAFVLALAVVCRCTI